MLNDTNTGTGLLLYRPGLSVQQLLLQQSVITTSNNKSRFLFQEYSKYHIVVASNYAYSYRWWQNQIPRQLKSIIQNSNIITFEDVRVNSKKNLNNVVAYPNLYVGNRCVRKDDNDDDDTKITTQESFLQRLTEILQDEETYQRKYKTLLANKHLFDWETLYPFDTYMYMLQAKLYPETITTKATTSDSDSILLLPSSPHKK